MTSYFQSFQRSQLTFHTLKRAEQGLYFTGMIIWLQCSFPLWDLQMLCYELMFWLTLLNRLYKILKKLFQPLMLNKCKLERWFHKTDWLHKEVLVHYSYPMLYIYISDMNTNVTHFSKHMDKMIQVIDSTETSVSSLWEVLTSTPWCKTILII